MSNISSFRNVHKGGTILLVGNGENLRLTPPEYFDFPSIGMNTIHLYDGWIPSYYVTVDRRVMREFGNAVYAKFAHIPKFIPSPKLNKWKGENFFRFRSRPGPLLSPKERSQKIWQNDIANAELTYVNVMHVAIKLAYFMGAETILIIGMEHKSHNARGHFWGHDAGIKSADSNLPDIYAGYRQLCTGLAARGVKLINISKDTFVPENVIPRDDWRKWTDFQVAHYLNVEPQFELAEEPPKE